MISTKDFRLFQALVQQEAGIFLSDQKRALLVGRLGPRMRTLELPTFGSYYERVRGDREELVQMINAICTHETQFFREPKQFAFLEHEVLPAWRASDRPKRVRVWSAGCSTGEEPFSIAMALSWHLPGWSIEILASDLSTKALERASAGIWPIERAEQIPAHYRRTFMLRGRGTQEARMAARPEIASLIRFQQLNLNCDSSYSGSFDLIFCRNVLIYFDAHGKRRVIDRLLDRLTPEGLLFLGHSESLHGFERVRVAGPTVYELS
jgi:chemotaxis protein methyltransferase CheR